MSFTRMAYTLAPCSGVLCTKDRFKFPNPPQDCFGCWQPASGCGDLHEHAWGNLRATIQSVPITRLELKLGLLTDAEFQNLKDALCNCWLS